MACKPPMENKIIGETTNSRRLKVPLRWRLTLLSSDGSPLTCCTWKEELPYDTRPSNSPMGRNPLSPHLSSSTYAHCHPRYSIYTGVTPPGFHSPSLQWTLPACLAWRQGTLGVPSPCLLFHFLFLLFSLNCSSSPMSIDRSSPLQVFHFCRNSMLFGGTDSLWSRVASWPCPAPMSQHHRRMCQHFLEAESLRGFGSWRDSLWILFWVGCLCELAICWMWHIGVGSLCTRSWRAPRAASNSAMTLTCSTGRSSLNLWSAVITEISWRWMLLSSLVWNLGWL